MGHPLPPLKGLRAFEAAARQGSFTRAAEELSVTPAAVSHQVKRLEDYLGVRLFRRLTGGLALTDAGAAIHADVVDAFQRLSRAAERLRGSAEERTIAVSVMPSLSSRWLVPRIERFHAAHPGHELRIDAREQAVDLRREDVDVALRYGPGDYPGLHIERLPSQQVYPVCSPALLASGPPIERPADLLEHTLLQVEWRHAADIEPPDWRWWLQAVGVDPHPSRTGPRFSQQSLAIDAAVAGQGLALANDLLVADDLAAGRLQRPLREAVESAYGHFLVCLPETAETPRVRAFREWIWSEIATADTPV